jgi:hypothetical protein
MVRVYYILAVWRSEDPASDGTIETLDNIEPVLYPVPWTLGLGIPAGLWNFPQQGPATDLSELVGNGVMEGVDCRFVILASMHQE